MPDISDREIVVTRTFNAPRELVFGAWTDPDKLVRWWGPKGFTITIEKIDVKVGGSWRFIMHGPNGVDYPNTVVYEEIVPPERLVYSHGGSADEAAQFKTTVTFVEEDRRTKVAMRLLFNTVEGRERAVREFRAIEGAEQTLERLGEELMKRSGYASVNGLKMYYEMHGSGEPLILMHGGVGSTGMFDPIMPELSENHLVIAVDLQAHGRTANIDRPLRYEMLADDIAALIKYLDFEKADVMGYSLGGGVAIQTAIRHPEVVRKLVVVSHPFKRDGWYPEIQAGMAQGMSAAEPMKHSPMYPIYTSIAPRPEDWPVLFTKLGDMLGRDYDWSKEVVALKAPTLLVTGDADSMRPSQAVEFFGLLGGGQRDAGWDGSSRPKSQLAILPGTTHYNIFMSPRLVEIVLPFLDAK